MPLRGTHAHSSVLAFPSEIDAFRAVAASARDGVTLLIDTYDTLRGARAAVDVAREIVAKGGRLAGVRLDSGDLAYLSIEVRKILDGAGFADARIFASGDLDEHVIASLKEQGARIDAWGVGTRLMTGHPDAALSGIYKLSAIQAPGGAWQHRLKRSDHAAKSTVPGILQVRRFENSDGFVMDAVFDELLPVPSSWEIVDPADPTRRKRVESGATGTSLLEPIFRGGIRQREAPPIADARARVREQLSRLHPGVRRLVNPHEYPAGLERALHELRHRALNAAVAPAAGHPSHEEVRV